MQGFVRLCWLTGPMGQIRCPLRPLRLMAAVFIGSGWKLCATCMMKFLETKKPVKLVDGRYFGDKWDKAKNEKQARVAQTILGQMRTAGVKGIPASNREQRKSMTSAERRQAKKAKLMELEAAMLKRCTELAQEVRAISRGGRSKMSGSRPRRAFPMGGSHRRRKSRRAGLSRTGQCYCGPRDVETHIPP